MNVYSLVKVQTRENPFTNNYRNKAKGKSLLKKNKKATFQEWAPIAQTEDCLLSLVTFPNKLNFFQYLLSQQPM